MRIIPARAGFTWGPGRGWRPRRDHPRSRGVYPYISMRRTPEAGSSPLARGLRTVDPPRDGDVGIIPARAGFTARGRRRSPRGRDHPRSRGVYASSVSVSPVSQGSSPLARGLRERGRRRVPARRIIPARAGFTSTAPEGEPLPADHPRSRGVYTYIVGSDADLGGSSPLARGLRAGRPRAPVGPGIIPARAGFTSPRTTRTPGPPDHPRSRGVYACEEEAAHMLAGSSPLARGLPTARKVEGEVRRIIPARAGFTRRALGQPERDSDHPRSRGVYR